NLAPADVRKEGAAFDLAIAVGVTEAREDRGAEIGARDDAVLLGELSLDGGLRPVRGLLAIVLAAAARGDRRFVVPAAQAWEARLAGGGEVLGATTPGAAPPPPVAPAAGPDEAAFWLGLAGQPEAQRAALIAAAGRHNLLLVGPPGTGKTRLARAIRGLLPPLGAAEAIEVARIHGAAGTLRGNGLSRRRPLRAPHHTVTRAGLLGGGSPLRPGEATLAHRGVLFLDELPEFAPAVLDALREPLEEGRIAVARGSGARSFPAAFLLVAAMNPCRCGHLGSLRRPCRCAPSAVARHRARVSGPLLDRVDLFVEMGEPPAGLLSGPLATSGDATAAGDAARWRALQRQVRGAWSRLGAQLPPGCERRLDPRGFAAAAGLDREARDCLEEARLSLALSVRGALRCARVARTIAALRGAARTGRGDVAEALRYRLEALAGWAPGEETDGDGTGGPPGAG
ncbi:MAG: YifB family Mg chelatase-like AAA ATPase, partial [Candidatus Krumholzibacteriia bacterium]